MTIIPKHDLFANTNWHTLTAKELSAGYAVAEAETRFPRETLAEDALRICGALLTLAGFVQWVLKGALFPGASLQMTLVLTVLFVGTGVALYLFASRGFRRVLTMNMGARKFVIARVNSKGRSLVSRSIGLQDVESIFLRRDACAGGQATLNIREKSLGRSLPVLAGDLAELQSLHNRLCDDVRTALECAPRRVRRRKSARPEAPRRPNKRGARQVNSSMIPAE